MQEHPHRVLQSPCWNLNANRSHGHVVTYLTHTRNSVFDKRSDRHYVSACFLSRESCNTEMLHIRYHNTGMKRNIKTLTLSCNKFFHLETCKTENQRFGLLRSLFITKQVTNIQQNYQRKSEACVELCRACPLSKLYGS